MSSFSFTDPTTGKPFKIKGPPTLTEAQARQIFEKQLDSGSLVGLKPGAILSAASQAASGLKSALSQVTQAAAGIGGSATGALQGALKQTAGGLLNASSLPAPVAGLATTAQSYAAKAIGGITAAIGAAPVTQGIGIANFAQQATALAPIGNLSVPAVTATLGQVSKLVGQGVSAVSNTLGVGKFGLDASQLEASGFIKPGTAATFLASGTNQLTSVLKSPTVWTGKDGIKGLSDMLGSGSAQDKVQQTLMAGAKVGLDAVGIPMDKLNPAALAGTLANGAKSLTDTAKWATGQALPLDAKAALDKVAGASAFATNFSELKVPEAFKEQEIPAAVNNTVNRATLNAAASRIIGNKKIPSISYG